MVRAAADRVFLPTKNLLEQVGDMMILTGKTLVSALRPPYPYGTEFVQQFLFMLRLCWLPLTISTIAFGSVIAGGALIVAASGLRDSSLRRSCVIRTCSV